MRRSIWNIGTIAVAALLMGVCFATADDTDEDGISSAMVKSLVKKTAGDIAKDAAGTIEKINASEHPYVDKDIKAFYVFIYDSEVNMIAHPNNSLVGRNYKGRPDVKGKNFRDAIVEGALANGEGWEDYAYQKPGAQGIYSKTAYYLKTVGNDKKVYVIIAGKYKTM